ncbi:MAG: alpha/beta hydrolase [Aliiglaciecola sp.]|uniref:alpha/beta hydrolase n=1 Tax=Aliiglaciecola sp. M165 TaxID=2593649 RepID=UPI00117EA7EA|nr:dienelactone hydrolase family protein [Aliiglaciecola sp. M165]TRY33205.1 alpha/beta hydrolase [Aliiglaciecola sp. M165]
MKQLIRTTAIASLISLSIAGQLQAASKQTVTFQSNGQTLVGDLYLPDDYASGQKLPSIIVSGSWTSVKEQMAGAYAEKIADKGYAALAFDFRGWGESAQGTPQSLTFVEDPYEKTQDILAAAEFLQSRPEVNEHQLATLGICASAGYAIDAAHLSPEISSVAVVAPWLHDSDIVDQVYGDNVPLLLSATANAKAQDAPVILEAASDTNQNAVMYQASYYTDPSRGAINEYDNKFSTLSWEPWLTYDAIQTASSLNDPLLMVHSEAAAIPQGAKKFAQNAGDNVSLVMLENVTQFDFYDEPEAMQTAIDKLHVHFQSSFK